MLLLIKGRLFLTVSLLFSKFIYKMGNSTEAPLYHSTLSEWSDTANHQWSYANLLILCICVFCKPIILLLAIIAVYFLCHTLLVPPLWYCRARSTVLLVPNKPFCSCSCSCLLSYELKKVMMHVLFAVL